MVSGFHVSENGMSKGVESTILSSSIMLLLSVSDMAQFAFTKSFCNESPVDCDNGHKYLSQYRYVSIEKK